MKLCSIAILLSAVSICFDSIAALTPPLWAIVNRNSHRPAGLGMTNGERLRRGLSLAPPVRLYQVKVAAQAFNNLRERAVPGAPAAAGPSGAPQRYTLRGCPINGSDRGAGGFNAKLTYTSLQDLANQCATLLDNSPNVAIRGFAIRPNAAAGIDDCYVGVSPRAGSQSCESISSQTATYM